VWLLDTYSPKKTQEEPGMIETYKKEEVNGHDIREQKDNEVTA
jgi:hypothetical protein